MKVVRKDGEVFYLGIGNRTKIGTIAYIENRKDYYNEILYSSELDYNQVKDDALKYIDTIEIEK